MTTTQQAKAFLQAADSLAGLKPAMLAEQLEISETTLRRKLRQEGANFAKLLTEERKWRCAQALAANPHISLADLSDICGFSMSSVMQRAFEVWYDETITQWRERVAP